MPQIHSSFWSREDCRATKCRDTSAKFVSAVVQGVYKTRKREPHTFPIGPWTTLSVQTTSCVFKSELTNASLLKVKVCVAYASESLSLQVLQECGGLWGRFRTIQKCILTSRRKDVEHGEKEKKKKKTNKERSGIKKKTRQERGWHWEKEKAEQLWAAVSQNQCLSLALVCNLNVMQRKI